MTAALISGAVCVNTALADSKRPVALIEELENAPDAELLAFDYAYKGDKIDLRPSGRAVLAYFDSCEVETVTGGLIKIGKDDADISKGGSSSKYMRDCRTAQVELDDEAKEAGAAVKRASPFDSEVWKEVALNMRTPMFKWPYEKKAKGEVTLQIFYADAPQEQLIWQTVTDKNYVTYPADAPAFVTGKPYRVVASYPKKYAYSAVFSYDPGLQMNASPINRLVPLE